MAAAFFWISVGVLVWVYVGYPLVVALIARVAPARLVAKDPAPSLTVAIAVHNEAANITARIADAFEQERWGATITEVIVGSDGSDDETERIVRELAQSEPRLKLLTLPRAGQTATQNALFEAATGGAVVLTDAETR